MPHLDQQPLALVPDLENAILNYDLMVVFFGVDLG
jgi:hypothetical protein